ncbi:MAG: type II toxin-antitoxin system PemK/MazF family toxin, partial [Acetivibrio sp.]
HVEITAEKYAIVKDSVILMEQVRTIDKSRLKERVCHLDPDILKQIDKALLVSLALDE